MRHGTRLVRRHQPQKGTEHTIDLIRLDKSMRLRRLGSEPEQLGLQHHCAGALQVGLIAPSGFFGHRLCTAGSALENLAELLNDFTPRISVQADPGKNRCQVTGDLAPFSFVNLSSRPVQKLQVLCHWHRKKTLQTCTAAGWISIKF